MRRSDRFYVVSTKAFCMTCGVTIDCCIDIGPASGFDLLNLHEEWHQRQEMQPVPAEDKPDAR